MRIYLFCAGIREKCKPRNEGCRKLHQFLEDEIEEQSFDLSAVKSLESETVQNFLKKVAEKYGAQNPF